MRKYLTAATLLLTLCAAASAAEPDPACFFGGKTAAFITVRQPRPWVGAAAPLLRSLLPDAEKAIQTFLAESRGLLSGPVAVGLMPAFDKKLSGAWVARIPLAAAKEPPAKRVTSLLTKLFPPKAFALSVTQGVHTLELGRPAFRVFWTVHHGVLYASNDRRRIEMRTAADRVGKSELRRLPSLADAGFYKQLRKHLDPTGDIHVCCDLKRLVWAVADRRFAPGPLPLGSQGFLRALYQWLNPGQFRAVGLSWKGDGKTASVRIAALVPKPKTRAGVVTLFDVPNAPPAHLDRLPSDVLLYATSAPTAGTIGRVARFFARLDPDVGKEFRTELAEFNRELGVDIGADLLDNLGSVAGAVRVGKLGPELLNVCTVRDAGRLVRCANALAGYNKTPLRKLEHNGRTYHILPMEPPMGWTFDTGRLFFSNTFEGAEAMLALGKTEGEKTLATQPMFRKLRARLPKKAVMFWALDVGRVAKTARGLLGLAALGGGVPKEMGGLLKWLEPFSKTEPGLSIGLALRNEPDAFVLHVESLAGDPLPLAAGLADILRPALTKSRTEARKVKSAANASAMAKAAYLWLDTKGQKQFYPASLKQLADDGLIEDTKIFLCPASGSRLAKDKFVSDYDSLFDRAGFQADEKDVPVDMMLVWEKKAFFPDGRNVAFADAHVEFVTEERFQRELKTLDVWLEKHKPRK